MEKDIQSYLEQAPDLIIFYGGKLLLALVIFFIGKIIANAISNVIYKGMTKKSVDVTVAKFTRNIFFYILIIVIIIAALGQIGIQTASFVAIIGAAGLAIGLALQGSLSNFAAGVLLILFRPFKVGDFVEAAGSSGSVHEVSIFTTILLTPDNKVITLSNSSVMNNTIVNYSAREQRRVDFVVGVSYDSDIAKVKSILESIAKAEERLIADKDIVVALGEFGDSSINFYLRVWVNTPDFWAVKFAIHEEIKHAFDKEGIEIPFPQMDVHVKELAAKAE